MPRYCPCVKFGTQVRRTTVTTKEPMEEIAAMRDYAPEAIALLRQIAANDHLMESEISIVLSWRIRNLLREIDKAS